MSACEVCGWAAAFCSMLAFGTFGVPIKSKTARQLDIDPLVFQSYKTFVCFATSWLVLLFGSDVKFEFTPWGIVSGLFWVPGGVATVYAIKVVGLAVGIGVGSSFIVLVSFAWGIFIFDEHVHSKYAATFAVFCMMLGLMGMSYYSAPDSAELINDDGVLDTSNGIMQQAGNYSDAPSTHSELNSSVQVDDTVVRQTTPVGRNIRLKKGRLYQDLPTSSCSNDENDEEQNEAIHLGIKNTERTDVTSITDTSQNSSSDNSNASMSSARLSPRESVGEDDGAAVTNITSATNGPLQDVGCNGVIQASPDIVLFCNNRIAIPKRHLGILASAFCGIWGGSILVPMKWCKSDTKGTHYLISFAIGASVVTLTLWLLRFCYYYTCLYNFSASDSYQALPSFHFRKLWLAGGTCGLLWSIGNFFSLISVFYLGEGVGYPLVQTSILVSGLWGIFYFKEVTGVERVTKWMCSSLLTIFGILLLSYEHHEK